MSLGHPPRAPVSRRVHTGGIVVTVYRYWEQGPYVHDFVSRDAPRFTRFCQSAEDAQGVADLELRTSGHRCGPCCDEWCAI